ncbi:MAG: Gfo/Idh/MocA family protein [Rhodothermales bacterium]
MRTTLRWGMVGLGRIAHTFARDLARFQNASLVAVGSRSRENARAFAAEHGARWAYDSYEAVYTHPDVDIVYVATPHHQHAELSRAALRAGKHVLCEKPAAINAAQMTSIISAANEADRFFMEALWSRFNPVLAEVIQRTRDGQIGPVRFIEADFSFRLQASEGSRTHDKAQGGGALLDVGIYPIFLAYTLLGVPETVQASMIRHPSGVDEQVAVIMAYEKALATAYAGFASPSGLEATISGEEGRFVVHPLWHEAESYTYFRNGEWEGERLTRPKTGHGLWHEIAACQTAIGRGETECALWTHQDALNLITILDRVRDAIGLVYPSDIGGST